VTIRVLALLLASVILLPPASADSGYRFSDVARVVAFADVHGAYDELVSLLRQTGGRRRSWTIRCAGTAAPPTW